MRLLRFERFIAARYLRSKRKEVFISIITVISILSVWISVMVLNIVLSIMTGFQEEFQAKLINAGAEIRISQYGGGVQNWQEVAEQLKGLPEVDGILPYTDNQALMSIEGRAKGVLVKGFHSGEASLKKLQTYLGEGVDAARVLKKRSYSDPQTGRVVNLPPLLIGEEMARRIGVFPGSPVTIISPNFSSSPQGLVPRSKRFMVVSLYRSGLNDFDASVVITELTEAQKFLGDKDTVSAIEVDIADPLKAPEVKLAIDQKLQGDYFILTWMELNRPFWEALKLEKQVYYVVLSLLTLIATFTVVAAMVMVVIEKSKDIAMLKTLGATNAQVMRAFLLQGIYIGAVGTVLGTISGYYGSLYIPDIVSVLGIQIDPQVWNVDTLPVKVELSNFVRVAVSAFLITSLGGVYPARRAAKLRPAEFLKYD